jgi:membrane-associated phospholipid phosphatase
MWCVFFLLSFALSDYISASLIKPFFHRPRPCNNPELADAVRILVPCGSGYSFPSTHAANHFCLGMFAAVTLSRRVRWIWVICLLWATIVSYAQVYVGVHYPLDVTCGGLLGIAIGASTGRIFNKRYDLAQA